MPVAATFPVGKFVAFAGFGVVLLWIAYLARWGILVVYLSALIATGISPLAGWIQRRRVPGIRAHPPRWLAALAVYLTGLGLLVGVGWAIVPPLILQARALTQNWPSLLEGAERFLLQHGLIAHQMSTHDLVQQLPADLGGAVLQQFWSVIGGVFGLLLILVLSLYLLHDAQRLHEGLLSALPPSRRRQVGRLSRVITRRIGAWMTGQLLLSGIIGATTAVALGLIGVPYFYVLAVLSAVGELIPYAGPVIASIPGILLALTVSWQTSLAVLLFYVCQQQLENHVLVPKLMQHQVGLTPSVVIIAITIGWTVLGVLGAIIAVPTAAILQVAVVALAPRQTDRQQRAHDGRG